MAENLTFNLEFSSAQAATEARDAGQALRELDKAIGGVDSAAKVGQKSTDALTTAMGRQSSASSKAGTTADRALASVGNGADSASKKVLSLGDSINKVKGWLDGLSIGGAALGFGALQGAQAVIGGIKDAWVGVVEVIGEGIRRAYEWGGVIVDSASKAERLRVGLDVSLGARGGAAAAGYIRQVSRGGIGSFREQDLAPATQRLAQAGFSGGALARALTAATDVEAGQGGGVATIERVVQLLRKTKLSGKLEAEALTELGVNTSELFKDLGKRKGISEKAARQLAAQAGGFSSDALINAVERAIAGPGGTLGEKTLKAAGTVQSKLEQLKALPDRYFRAVADTSGYGKLSDFLTTLLEKLDPDSPNGRRIQFALSKVSAALGALFGAGEGKGDVFSKIADGIVLVLGGVTKVLPWFKALFTVIGQIADYTERVIGLFTKFNNLGDTVFAKLGFGGGGDTAKALTDGLSKGIDAGGADVAAASRRLAQNSVIGTVDQTAKIQSPSRVLTDRGLKMGAGVALGIEQSADQVADAVADAWTTPAVPRAGGAIQQTAAPARGAINVYVTVPATTEIHAAANAQEVADVVEQRLQGRAEVSLQAALAALAAEWGVA